MIDREAGFIRGIASGYELTGLPFSSKMILKRLPKKIPYPNFKGRTGLFNSLEEILDVISESFGPEHIILDSVRSLEDTSYLNVPIDGQSA